MQLKVNHITLKSSIVMIKAPWIERIFAQFWTDLFITFPNLLKKKAECERKLVWLCIAYKVFFHYPFQEHSLFLLKNSWDEKSQCTGAHKCYTAYSYEVHTSQYFMLLSSTVNSLFWAFPFLLAFFLQPYEFKVLYIQILLHAIEVIKLGTTYAAQ